MNPNTMTAEDYAGIYALLSIIVPVLMAAGCGILFWINHRR